MATVRFTSALKRFFPTLEPIEVQGMSVRDIVDGVEDRFPGMRDYLVEENGSLRKHVNIFIKDELIQDKEGLSDPVHAQDEVHIYQALSGG